jgi:hypothetical protein
VTDENYARLYEGVGRNSSVDIATGYGLDGPGIEPRWGLDFSHTSRKALGTHPVSYTMGTGSFQGVDNGRDGMLTTHLF